MRRSGGVFGKVFSLYAGLEDETTWDSGATTEIQEGLPIGGGVESALSCTGVELINSEEKEGGEGDDTDTTTGEIEGDLFLDFEKFSVKRELCIAKEKRG